MSVPSWNARADRAGDVGLRGDPCSPTGWLTIGAQKVTHDAVPFWGMAIVPREKIALQWMMNHLSGNMSEH
jgi:hypothetical protein